MKRKIVVLYFGVMGLSACGVQPPAPYLDEERCSQTIASWTDGPLDPGPRGMTACFFDDRAEPYDCNIREEIVANRRCAVELQCGEDTFYELGLRTDGSVTVEKYSRSRTAFRTARCEQRTFFAASGCHAELTRRYGGPYEYQKFWCPLRNKATGEVTALQIDNPSAAPKVTFHYSYPERRCEAWFPVPGLTIMNKIIYEIGKDARFAVTLAVDGPDAERYEAVPGMPCTPAK